MIFARWCAHTLAFPVTVEPEWKNQVERWYQMDGAAFALTATYWHHRPLLNVPPEWMLLASPRASNRTDVQFAAAISPSPAKFVHTLPNIRAACVLQVMGASAQVLCLQKDPITLITALSEAMQMILNGGGPVWVLSVSELGSSFTGHIFILSREAQHATLKIAKRSAPTMETRVAHDTALFSWLNRSEQEDRNFIADDFEIIKSQGFQSAG